MIIGVDRQQIQKGIGGSNGRDLDRRRIFAGGAYRLTPNRCAGGQGGVDLVQVVPRGGVVLGESEDVQELVARAREIARVEEIGEGRSPNRSTTPGRGGGPAFCESIPVQPGSPTPAVGPS